MVWVLLHIEISVWAKVQKYLQRLGVFFRTFPQIEYRVVVTAEERNAARSNRGGDLNPPQAWKTCASCKQVWDEESRGPWPKYPHELERTGNTAPRGKGWVEDQYGRRRVAGECANPIMLNYISCPMHCTRYEPTTIEGLVWLSEHVAEEHRRRAELLQNQAEFLRQTAMTYEEVIASGKVFSHRGGRFQLADPGDE